MVKLHHRDRVLKEQMSGNRYLKKKEIIKTEKKYIIYIYPCIVVCMLMCPYLIVIRSRILRRVVLHDLKCSGPSFNRNYILLKIITKCDY